MAWLSLYAYITALIGAVLWYNRLVFRLSGVRVHQSEFGGIAVALLAVWVLVTLDFYVGAQGKAHLISTILVQIAAGAWIGFTYRNGVSGAVTLLFIPMVLVNTVQYATGFLTAWDYFYVMSLLSWLQIIAFFAGAESDAVGVFFDKYTRSRRLFDIMAARYRGNQ